jgi:hypothetical protein
MSDHVFRATFGVDNGNEDTEAIVAAAQHHGLDGLTLVYGKGWTQTWGWEENTTIEFTSMCEDEDRFLRDLLETFGEEAVYVTRDGADPRLVRRVP